MLSSSYQPALRGSRTGWFGKSAIQPVPVNSCMRVSEQHVVVVTEERKQRGTKDVWRPKTHLLKSSEAAESTSYSSTRNGFSLANVRNTAILCDTLEKDAADKRKKPGKDVWRSKEKESGASVSKADIRVAKKCDNPLCHVTLSPGSILLTGEKETGASESKADIWLAQKCNNPVSHVALSPGSNLLTEEQPSPQKYTKRRSSGNNVWRSRRIEDMSALNLQTPGNSSKSRKRLYLLDIHPLCYNGSRVQPRKISEWMKLLFSEVTRDDPIIAVMDGERGNEYRRALLPSYKAKRNTFRPLIKNDVSSAAKDLRKALPLIRGFFTLCQIPVVKQEFAEADDIIATLARQARDLSFEVVIASPDMDFQQLLTPDVHMLLPLPELGRWSFYTLDHYVKQNTVTPDLELGLKCMLGDLSDNVPGLAAVARGFGRKTALKLMQKHGSLEKLLAAAAVRTVGREYIQDALTTHADLLRRNLQVLSLRSDVVGVALEEQWCQPRCVSNDALALNLLNERLRLA